ncbi:DLW-39 family protein [Phycicoccus duodecadis]|jgi:hypothetical protein|uniref:Uncharacterized protein n=1 Tax=Phycicoccus duodecadis TaxID=173053 RepID=A0A2N3YM85_9MICO|nr:DLW-39 family protein [Phycicoccus duodecadis]PKW27970.1 hypothetical protein ATL31_2822 [Phycicoccus duodecadis]
MFVKKLLVLVASAAGAFAISKQIRDKKAENQLWAEATDSPRS